MEYGNVIAEGVKKMIKCDKCGSTIKTNIWNKRFIDQFGEVDLCEKCENERTELLDKTETYWFSGQLKEIRLRGMEDKE